MEDIETGEMVLKIIATEIDPNEITSVLFNEEWFFDEKNFKMEKRVVGITPVRHFIRYDEIFDGEESEELQSLTFTLLFNDLQNKKEEKEFDKRKILLRKIEYLFPMFNDVEIKDRKTLDSILKKNNIYSGDSTIYGPFWNDYSKEKFIDNIFNKVTSGKAKAYDFYNNNVLSVSEINKRITRIDTVQFLDYDTEELKETIVKTDFYPRLLKSVIFIEEWYLDPETLRMEKKVVGVAPVLGNPVKDNLYIPFKVLFN